MPVLTIEQEQVIELAGNGPVEIVDPHTKIAYYLVRTDLFREMHDLLDEERQREAIAQNAKRNAAARMDEE